MIEYNNDNSVIVMIVYLCVHPVVHVQAITGFDAGAAWRRQRRSTIW